MADRFEIRQRVGTVHKRWMEVVVEGMVERVARLTYERLAEDYPTEYFELVRVISDEECLAFTAHR